MYIRTKTVFQHLTALVLVFVLMGQGIAFAESEDSGEFSVLAVKNYSYLVSLNSFSDADEFNSCFGVGGQIK